LFIVHFSSGIQQRISSRIVYTFNFIKYLEARARNSGFKIGKDYGEPFFCEEEIEYDLIGLINNGEKK